MIVQILIQQIVFIIKCQLTMELSWRSRLKNVLAQRRTTHATQCSNRSASVRFLRGLWRRPRRMAQRVPKSSDGGPVAARRRWPASASYFSLLSICFNGGQLLLQRWPASASGRHPWRAHGLTQRSTIEWGSPRCWLDYCSRFCWAALMTSNMSHNRQLSQILG